MKKSFKLAAAAMAAVMSASAFIGVSASAEAPTITKGSATYRDAVLYWEHPDDVEAYMVYAKHVWQKGEEEIVTYRPIRGIQKGQVGPFIWIQGLHPSTEYTFVVACCDYDARTNVYTPTDFSEEFTVETLAWDPSAETISLDLLR